MSNIPEHFDMQYADARLSEGDVFSIVITAAIT